MNNKTIKIGLAGCLLSLLAVPQALASPDSPVSISVNGIEIFTDAPAYIQADAGVTYVPIRVVSESLGANVTWVESTSTAIISKSGTVLELTLDQHSAKKNDQAVTLEAPAVMQNGRLMVPIRFVSEGLGISISWDPDSRLINLGTPAANPLFAAGSGNDPQNIHNNAMVTEYNGWLYYANVGDNNKLYRMSLDRSVNVQLTDEPVTDISAVDGWVYYRIYEHKEGKRTDAGEIYRIRTDGSSRTLLSEHETRHLFMKDGYLYYSRDKGMGSGPIYRMKLDGTDRSQLSGEDEEVFEMAPGGDWIYYTLNSGGLYRIDPESRESAAIDSDWYYDIRIVDGWLYYKDDKGYLHRMDLSGGGRSSIGDHPVGSFWINDNTVYYEQMVEGKWSSSESRLYRSGLDGSNPTLLVDKVILNINVIGERMYYMTYETINSDVHQYADIVNTLSRMNLDGTDKQNITSKTTNPFPDLLRKK
ncbi:DUF5050 domain-containing protein [Paenibacillus sp. OAS669]|uniref:DUF5050 domain-containing protein n=1 Tax=Paenibacillus sp. OAS669 TaxID=2663821 RepID=UPI00178AC267|nr:DUF5050 domain-containing protein [Paenibacillus sp. OAS669]MBE1442111.1 hypothetical protein [Paenibacillus sp. OAS669]